MLLLKMYNLGVNSWGLIVGGHRAIDGMGTQKFQNCSSYLLAFYRVSSLFDVLVVNIDLWSESQCVVLTCRF